MKVLCFLLLSFLSLPVITSAEGLKFEGNTHHFDEYRGQITVMGEYSYYFNDEVLGDMVCFHPYAPSDTFIPRDATDHRSRWFCFTDTDQAIKAFKIDKKPKNGYIGYTGHATVHIAEYQVYKGESDGSDKAKLLSVKKLGSAKLIKSSGY